VDNENVVVAPSIVPVPPWCIVGGRRDGEPAFLPPDDADAAPPPEPGGDE